MPNNELRFICPSCGGDELRVALNVQVIGSGVSVKRVDRHGTISVTWECEDEMDSNVSAYLCPACGFEIENDDGEPIVDYNELAMWIMNHCGKQDNNSLRQDYVKRRTSRIKTA